MIVERVGVRVLIAMMVTSLAISLSSCQSGLRSSSKLNGSVDIEHVMNNVYPALVRIYVVSTQYSNGREIKRGGAGSGAIITPDGYVVTNHHVVGHGKKIWCTLPNRERVEADLVGTDPMADIAVIKLRPETMRNPVKEFPYAQWGDSKNLKVGQKVFALGSPGALAQSVTYGIISNPSMVLPGRGLYQDGEPVGMLVRWIFHDAQIFGGNSGGPLVDVHGKIVGVNEIGSAALGGAIPAHTAQESVRQLIAKGHVDRSWTGLNVQKLLQSDTSGRGILINGVSPNSPAEKSGLKVGDKIISINGKPINVLFQEQMPEYHRTFLEMPIGTVATIAYERDGNVVETKLTTVERGSVRSPQKELLSWGTTVRDMTLFDLVARKLKKPNGVLISTVRGGGPAGQAKPAIRGGDVIMMVGDKKVTSYKEILEVSKAVTEGKKSQKVPTLITFWRWGSEYKTVVAIGPEKKARVIPEARKAWFPANVQVLTKPLAKAMNLADKKGVRITKLYPQLKESKFKVGDIITHVGKDAIDAFEDVHMERFRDKIRQSKVGEIVTFTIMREEKEETVDYKMTRSPKPSREMVEYKNEFLDFSARQLSTLDKIGRDISLETKGVIASQVGSGGWAQLGGLRKNDIIKTVNGKAVKSGKALEIVLQKTMEEKPEALLFFVRRGNGHYYVEIRPRWNQ